MNVYETERVGRYTVNVVYDEDCSLSDAVNDEPVMIFERRDGVILDQSKRNFPPHAVLRAIDESDNDAILDELCGMSYSEWSSTDAGNIWAEHASWSRRRYFGGSAGPVARRHGIEAMIRALFRSEYGAELSDLKVEQFGRGDCRETYYLCFWQSEFDAYCGGKDCKSSLDSCQAILDGEVYGFIVSSDDDDHMESCWGFIGDAEYCMSEGKAAAAWRESKACEVDAAAIMESRSDMYQGRDRKSVV